MFKVYKPLFLHRFLQERFFLLQRLKREHIVTHYPGKGNMSVRWQQVRTIHNGFVRIVEKRQLLANRVTVHSNCCESIFKCMVVVNKIQAIAFGNWVDVFVEETCLFPCVGIRSGMPVPFIYVIGCITEPMFQISLLIIGSGSATVVKVKMCENHVRYIGWSHANGT